jgi:multiple antibiotic resistance protein
VIDAWSIPGLLLPLVFMMMGPIGLIPAFAAATAGLEQTAKHRIAFRAWGFATTGVVLAVVLGAGILGAWGASPSSLVIAAGVLLGLAALKNLLFREAAKPVAPASDPALSPLAVPTILSPYGVGVLIVFAAYIPSGTAKLAIAAVALFIIALDWLAMRYADPLMALIGSVALTLLGAVFGVLQLALGVEMIISGIERTAVP